jgi:hypothetical protein
MSADSEFLKGLVHRAFQEEFVEEQEEKRILLDDDDPGSVIWQHQQSLATDEAALSSTNISVGTLMGIVSGGIANSIVIGYIVPSTDALFLVFVGAVLAVIVLVALGQLFYWVALAATTTTTSIISFEGPRTNQERRREQLRVGVWANVLLLLCQFIMLIAAFVALQLLLEMFKIYYQTMPPGIMLQLIAIIWLVLIVLFFLVYPGIGLFQHAREVIDSGHAR